MKKDEVIKKVRKLFALSADKNGPEAEQARKKAEELMEEHGLVLSDIPTDAAGGYSGDPVDGSGEAQSSDDSWWKEFNDKDSNTIIDRNGTPWADAVLPAGYGLFKDGLFRFELNADDENRCVRRPITFGPVWMSKNARHIDTQHGRICLNYVSYGHTRELLIPRGLVFSGQIGREIGQYAGFPMLPGHKRVNIKSLTEYLLLAEQLAPTDTYRSSTGWVRTDDGEKFALYGENGVIIEPKGAGLWKRYRGIKRRGDRKVYLRTLFETLVANPLTCIPVAGALAAPLLLKLEAESPIIDVHHISSGGKTTTGFLSMSVYGDPRRLKRSWDGTKIGLEENANFFCDLPQFLDESQTQNPRDVAKIIYSLANGEGRERGAPFGMGVQEAGEWQTVVISTGEQSLFELSTMKRSGLDARTIPVKGETLGGYNADQIEELNRTTARNYGWVGYDYIRHLEQETDFEKMEERYLDYIDQLSDDVKIGDKIQRRKASAFATLLCAVDVLPELYPEYDDSIKLIKEHMFKFWAQICDEHGDRETAPKAYNALMDYYVANKSKFEGSSTVRKGSVYSTDKLIGFLETTWRDVLKKGGFDSSNIINEFIERGWIKTTTTKTGRIKHLTRTKINKEEVKLIVLTQEGRDEYENSLPDDDTASDD